MKKYIFIYSDYKHKADKVIITAHNFTNAKEIFQATMSNVTILSINHIN